MRKLGEFESCQAITDQSNLCENVFTVPADIVYWAVKKKVAYRIKKFRLARDLTVIYMAEKLQLSLSAYSKIERGITDVSVGRLEQIAGIFKVDLTDFFAETPLSADHENIELAELRRDLRDLTIVVTALKKEFTGFAQSTAKKKKTQ